MSRRLCSFVTGQLYVVSYRRALQSAQQCFIILAVIVSNCSTFAFSNLQSVHSNQQCSHILAISFSKCIPYLLSYSCSFHSTQQ